MARGRFITFEGGEGAGKSTQVQRLAQALRDAGIACIETREPGGSPFAEVIRGVILDPATPAHVPLAEALLFSAARADHLAATIEPALAAGQWVLCDRFTDSTRAYQGAAGGLDMDTINALEMVVVGDTQPDLTLVLDLAVDAGFGRVEERANQSGTGGGVDPYEGRDKDFHERLRQGFLRIAAAEPGRCQVIDAAASQEAVAADVWQIVVQRFAEVNG